MKFRDKNKINLKVEELPLGSIFLSICPNFKLASAKIW